MPLVYADTSALFAFFHPRDEFARSVMTAVLRDAPDFIYWPYLRFELRHNLRQARTDTHGEVAWRALRAAERTQSRLPWQPMLRLDATLEAADELSSTHAGEVAAGSGDFVHVAAACQFQRHSQLEAFWTCDAEQARLAKAVGLKVKLFQG